MRILAFSFIGFYGYFCFFGYGISRNPAIQKQHQLFDGIAVLNIVPIGSNRVFISGENQRYFAKIDKFL